MEKLPQKYWRCPIYPSVLDHKMQEYLGFFHNIYCYRNEHMPKRLTEFGSTDIPAQERLGFIISYYRHFAGLVY